MYYISVVGVRREHSARYYEKGDGCKIQWLIKLMTKYWNVISKLILIDIA